MSDENKLEIGLNSTVKSKTQYSSPTEYAEACGFDMSQPVTMDEITKVFGYRPLNPSVIVVDRELPPEKTGVLYMPDTVRKDRQTGAPKGRILWAGKKAEEEVNRLISETGWDYKFQVGDWLGFNVIHPQPLGLAWHGIMIMPGEDTSRYSGVEMVHIEDVRGYIPASDLE